MRINLPRIASASLLIIAAFPPASISQESASVTASGIFARGSSPEAVALATASAVQSDPKLSPQLVLDVVETFARNLSGVDLESAVSEVFRVLAELAPESVVTAVASVAGKYPALAVAVAEGAARGNPSLARLVSAAALQAAPETDQSTLATAVADAAALEYPVVLGWLGDPLDWAGLPSAAFPGGGGGGTRPRPYSE